MNNDLYAFGEVKKFFIFVSNIILLDLNDLNACTCITKSTHYLGD